MDTVKKSSRIALDWNRLLGFDQALRPGQAEAPTISGLGAKIGGKPCMRRS